LTEKAITHVCQLPRFSILNLILKRS